MGFPNGLKGNEGGQDLEAWERKARENGNPTGCKKIGKTRGKSRATGDGMGVGTSLQKNYGDGSSLKITIRGSQPAKGVGDRGQ